jgi:L-amino acid N-acyltransferase YncA
MPRALQPGKHIAERIGTVPTTGRKAYIRTVIATDTRIRLATPDDASSVAAIYAPYVTRTAVSFEEVPPTADAMRERIARALEQHAWLVASTQGHVVGYGYAGAHHPRAAYRWSVDTAVYLDGAVHRRGIGRRIYHALFTLLARQRYVNAYALITLPNAASVGLHEAMGFTAVGVYGAVGHKFGAWHDVGSWSRSLRTPPATPEEPLPLPDLSAAEVDAILAAAP